MPVTSADDSADVVEYLERLGTDALRVLVREFVDRDEKVRRLLEIRVSVSQSCDPGLSKRLASQVEESRIRGLSRVVRRSRWGASICRWANAPLCQDVALQS